MREKNIPTTSSPYINSVPCENCPILVTDLDPKIFFLKIGSLEKKITFQKMDMTLQINKKNVHFTSWTFF